MIIILAGKIGELKILEDAGDLLSRVSKFFVELAERHVRLVRKPKCEDDVSLVKKTLMTW